MRHSIFYLVLLLSVVSTSLAQLFGGSCEDPNSCAKRGVCINGPAEDTFWCRCAKGFGGDFCEQKCDRDCGDEQKCVLDRDKKPTCVCQGNNCVNFLLNQTEENPCLSHPCIHGKCFPYSGGFQCICANGYGGSYCRDGRDHCLEHNCKEGSKCINTPDGYYCACPPGRSGQFCEKIECEQMPEICNKGKCVQNPLLDKTFECVCDEGYGGEMCNMDKNECLENVCGNRGTCVNLPGSYRCDCKPGYAGKNCSTNVDRCAFIQCENNGTCSHTSKLEPVCICKEGFIGRRCETACRPGFTGSRCDVRKDLPVCTRTSGRCQNGGQCVGGFCVCTADFLGNQCEMRREEASLNTCESDPCMNNASCVNVDAEIGYVCFCPPGFEGDICERPTDICSHRPCANGGKCTRKGDKFNCDCPPGFSGPRCQQKMFFNCFEHTCQNQGICRSDGRSATCHCPYGFTGPRCEEEVRSTEPKETFLRNICELRNCSVLGGDGNCDEQCNHAACEFDKGDCSGGQRPFSECTYPIKCADLFANGVCDQECNNEKCLYDGLDCMPAVSRCPLKIREHCASRFDDKVCNPECNTEGCGFDGGDCLNRTEALILSDIRISIQMNSVEFQRTGGEMLMQIGVALRVTVRIQRDEAGPMVFEWDGENELERLSMDVKRLEKQNVLSKRIRRSASTIRGVVVYLEVEEVCQNDCRFTTAQSIVSMIAAGLTKTNGNQSFGLPITGAMVLAREPKISNEGWTRNQILLILVIAFLAFGTLVVGVILKTHEPDRSRKRKIVTAPIWMPPMDPAVDKSHRNKSIHSSQCSLLGANEPLGAKRHCGGNGTEYSGQQQQHYPQNISPFNGAFGLAPPVPHFSMGHTVELPAIQIPLHVQADGPGPISIPLTNELVNQVDCTFKRRVLHWLAANAKGKPDEMISSETVECLKAGADVNARDCDDNTALMLAVRAHRVRLAVYLLQGGADPTVFNKSERNALHEAAANKGLRMMEILLTDERLRQEIDELERNGMTALMMVARCEGELQVKMAKLLLSKGAKIDADGASRKDSDIYRGRTALHYAALSDNLPMVEFLVSKNAYKDKQDDSGKTPMMLAAKEGHQRTVKYLVDNGASLTIADSMDKTAAQIAKENYHHELAEFLGQALIDRNRHETVRRNGTAMSHGTVTGKTGRQTFKAVKRAGSRKAAVPSRESNHLTPPPSDGSFSSPSPLYFHTTSSTPTAMESSPEYGYQHPDMTNNNPMWSPYTDPNFPHPMQPNPVYNHQDPMNNSFFC